MSKIKNTAELRAYNEPAKPPIRIHSHWTREELVEIEAVPDPAGGRIVVNGKDLIRAVENCMNVGT